MRYYISDLHFGHEALNTQMDHRGFESAAAMDEYMIRQWNSRVRKNDEVVILGDFAIYKKAAEVEPILRRLNGRKGLIQGNHDHYLKDKSFDRSLFWFIEPTEEFRDDGRKVVMSHYPTFCYKGQYLRDKDDKPKVYMLYGHVHNSFDEYLVDRFVKETRDYARPTREPGAYQNIPCQMINCFCMFSDYVPLTLDEWIEVDRKRRANLKLEDFPDGIYQPEES